MKRRKKIKLQYKKERVVFSDILPYELPIIFSNRYFYRFLVNNKIAICNINSKDCNVSWSNEMPDGARFIMAILMNMNASPLLTCHEYKYNEFKSIPFVYNVQHKPTKPRQLAIVHPINQIKVVEFYNKYKDAIIYLCSKSNFSMRKPQKVASYFFYKDRLHHILLGRKTDKMEMYFKEYVLAQYREMKEFTQFASDLDDATKRQLQHGQVLMELLKQPLNHPMSHADMVIVLVVADAGILDDLDPKQVKKEETKLLDWFNENHSEISREINTTKKLDDNLKTRIITLAKQYRGQE